jgi:vitamin-K-epoxide reductase (warfarin-sensitive)
MVLAIPPAARRRAVGLRPQERQRKPKTQQHKQQTGRDPAHEQMHFTTSFAEAMQPSLRGQSLDDSTAFASYNHRTGDFVRYVIVLFALAGIVVSGLALKVHYDTGSEPCRINDKWDCGVVNHSPYAVIRGVPVAAIGIAGYLLIAVLGFLRRRGWLLVAVLAGLGFALYLTNIEAHVLEVWCLYCVISQAIIAVLTLLALIWLGWTRLRGASA